MTKLLVIDDERPILEILKISLGVEGYDIMTAESGDEGLKIFKDKGPKLVLTDIKMPGMDGIEVLKKIKGMDNEAEVIVVTGHGDMDSAIAALQYGASDFITKPIKDEVLMLALKRAEKKIAISQRLRDYTENLEQKIEEYKQKLEQAHKELIEKERLATIGETVAGLAHYIKNILTGVRGGMYMVNTGMAKNKPQMLKQGWDMVQRNIERISDLTFNLLRYSKERQPERSVCNPNEIVSEAMELFREKAKAHSIKLTKILDPNIKDAYLDRDAIDNVLLNLISNAVDACIDDPDLSKKWEVTVKTKLETDPDLGESILFQVSDNGSGMTDEVKEKLFTKFFSTKAGRGTGLGLLGTQKIVQEHGGKIWVESIAGQGTTFYVRLGRAMPKDEDES